MHSVPIEYHWNERNFHYLFSYILTIHFFDKCFLYVHTNMFFQNDHVIPHKCSFSIDCLKCLYRIVGFLLVDLWNLFTWLLIASSVVKTCKYISWDLDVCKMQCWWIIILTEWHPLKLHLRGTSNLWELLCFDNGPLTYLLHMSHWNWTFYL